MIRNLIFDVGDVLVEYRWFEMLTRDYGLEAKRIGGEMFDNEIWVQGLDGGKLSLEEAIHQYELKYPDDVDVMGWFLRNGEQMAVKRPEVWDKVAALKEKGYKIYLLSNYSEELFHVHTKGAKFLNVLDGGVVSYQVHALKPDRKIYETLCERFDITPENAVFLDDNAKNTETAREFGLHAITVENKEQTDRDLHVLGVTW